MKLKSGIGAGIALVLAYGLFLASYAPARLLTAVPLPAGMVVAEAAGTLWQGNLQRFSWRTLTLDDVHWNLTFSGFMPALEIAFKNPEGIAGRGIIRGWQQPQFYQWQLSVPAGYLFSHLRFIVPIGAEGNVQLNLQEATVDRSGCQSLDANITWPGARVKTPLGGLVLATPQATLRCQQGVLEANLRQTSSHLQLSGKGSVTPKGEYRFTGRLSSGNDLPATMKKLLATTGKADEQGARMLNFQGRLL
ncbi:type II secretion system protein N [Pectobacterium polaris]|uniref:type II secretion system protein N n=1 Tax=Pectobacterium polaris TaxID=2042057 RepID=UPI000D622058|nr:type II secretion system protein N [Pectobacterium polaris]MCU1788737.1 type II secretion system protein N [Pectobacterium polaris]PWD60349.1 type II secretion protein N [Pectobacterium polaris]